jgi:hypothetical protein
MSLTNAWVMRRAVEAIWNHGDLDVADELFAPDYVNHDGLIPDLVVGPEAIKICVAFYRLAFPNLHITVDELSSDEGMVVVRWTARNAPADAPKGCDVTANSSLTGTTRSRLAGGKIAETWTQWDRDGVLRELGRVPSK